jgi:hypothetical protein
VQLLPRIGAEAQARHDLVHAARKGREHRVGLRGVGRLADHVACTDDDGVHPEHRPTRPVDRARLAGRVLERIAARPLDVRRRDHFE